MENNKVVIITGGSRGLGLAITNKFLAENYKVLICAREKNSNIPESPNLIFLKGDVSKPLIHEELVKKAINEFGSLNVFINNAGLSQWCPIEDIDKDFLDKLFSSNLYSAFWGCKAALKFLKRGDSIINISSIAGKRGSKNNSAYVATKFAMNGLTQSLSKEVGPKGIRVNAICPVLVKTEGLLSALNQKNSPGFPDPYEFIDKFRKSQSALERLPNAEEVAEMALFLASGRASAITGQCINVDCGVFPQ